MNFLSKSLLSFATAGACILFDIAPVAAGIFPTRGRFVIEHRVSGLVLNVPGGPRAGNLVGVNLWQRVPGDMEQVWFSSLRTDSYSQIRNISGTSNSFGGACLNLTRARSGTGVTTYNCVPGDRLQGFTRIYPRYGGRREMLIMLKTNNPYHFPQSRCLRSLHRRAQWNGMPVVIDRCDFNDPSQWWRVLQIR